MARIRKTTSGSPQRNVSVRGVRRSTPDLRKLSRAVIQLAMEQAAIEAAAEADDRQHDDERQEPGDA